MSLSCFFHAKEKQTETRNHKKCSKLVIFRKWSYLEYSSIQEGALNIRPLNEPLHSLYAFPGTMGYMLVCLLFLFLRRSIIFINFSASLKGKNYSKVDLTIICCFVTSHR